MFAPLSHVCLEIRAQGLLGQRNMEVTVEGIRDRDSRLSGRTINSVHMGGINPALDTVYGPGKGLVPADIANCFIGVATWMIQMLIISLPMSSAFLFYVFRVWLLIKAHRALLV